MRTQSTRRVLILAAFAALGLMACDGGQPAAGTSTAAATAAVTASGTASTPAATASPAPTATATATAATTPAVTAAATSPTVPPVPTSTPAPPAVTPLPTPVPAPTEPPPAPPPPPPAPMDAAVDIAGFQFGPASITAGGTVTWTNRDTVQHDVVASDGSFQSLVLEQGESYSVRFDRPGSFSYICSIHPFMAGTVVVR